MRLLPDKVQKFFSQLPAQPIVVAYSGGVDSQVLLHVLAQLEQRQLIAGPVTACHINHGLSENADSWQQFASAQCQALNIPLEIVKLNIVNQPQQSLEALARDARYQALSNKSPPQSLICTGHHQDDQVETFILALKRGSGVKGLSAMPSVSHYGDTSQLIVRPLLDCTRAEIVDYAKHYGLSWINDESNDNTAFDRNFIRHQLLPQFQQRWPSIVQTISRSVEHCQHAQQLIEEVAQADLALCLADENSLYVAKLAELSQLRFAEVIRTFLTKKRCLMPSTAQLEQLFRQVFSASDRQVAVKLGQVWLRKFQDKLYLTPNYQPVDDWSFSLNIPTCAEFNEKIELPDGLGTLQIVHAEKTGLAGGELCFVLPEDIKVLTISFTHHNPKCHPDYRKHSRPLKKVLQELAIPPWQRKRIPLVFAEQQLVAVADHFVCQPFVAADDSRNIIVRWLGCHESG